MSNKFKNPITGKFMKKSVAWINRFGDEFELKDINNEYLMKILICIPQGTGYSCIVENKEKINALYQEAYNRNLTNYAVIFNLHTWALCVWGFEDNFPSWFLSPNDITR
jgi:hypothetical protein